LACIHGKDAGIGDDDVGGHDTPLEKGKAAP
jgi:hypothetical protein